MKAVLSRINQVFMIIKRSKFQENMSFSTPNKKQSRKFVDRIQNMQTSAMKKYSFISNIITITHKWLYRLIGYLQIW